MSDKNNNELMDKIVSLAKRRGFIFPSSEIYGGYQAIKWDDKNKVYFGASESRKDGQAAGY